MGSGFLDGFPLGGAEGLLAVDLLNEPGQFVVVQAFLDKGIQIVVAGGVEQAETGEVPFGTELLRGGGKQKDGGDFSGEPFHHLVGGAGELGCPFEVVGFVDYEKIPLSIEHLGVAFHGTR